MSVRRLLVVVSLFVCGTAAATHPLPPVNLTQQAPQGTNLPAGAVTSATTLYLGASSDASTNGTATYSLELEIRPVGTAFTNTPTHPGGSLGLLNKPASLTPYPLAAITGLAPGAYKWQVREKVDSITGTWVQFNAGQTAFEISGVNVLPATTSFGAVRTGQTSAPMTLEVSNDTPNAVTLNTASITAGAPFTITSGPTLPMTLNPGSKVAFTVTAHPTTLGPQTASFSVSSSQPNSPHTGTLSVIGAEPALTFVDVSVAFGDIGINGPGVTRTVTVNNTGNYPLQILDASVAPPFSVSGTLPATVQPGASHILEMTFAPATLGTHTGTLTLLTDANGSPHSVPLTGSGIDPKVSLDQSQITFPDTVFATSSAPVTVTLTNTGVGTLALAAPVLSGPFTTTLTPRTVAAGATTTFQVTFNPTTPGAKTGSLTIPSNDASTPAVLALEGISRAAQLAVTPANHAFGNVMLGVSQTTTFTLSNPGDAVLNVTSLTVGGTNAAEFSLQGAPPTPFTVPVGGSLQFSVAFAPVSVGVRSASIQIGSNRFPTGPVSLPLTGTGEGTRMSLNATSLNFGFVNVGATSARTFEIGNSGTTPLTVNGLTFHAAHASDFATSKQVPFTIQPGATTTVSVTFTPGALGLRQASLTVASDDGLNPAAEIALSGTAMSPNLVVGQSSLAFGPVRVGQETLLSISVRNDGNGTLTVSGASIVGDDASQFGVAPLGSTGLSLSAGGSAKNIVVSYRPTTIGAANAALFLVSDDPDAPTVSIPLSGEGTAPALSLSVTSLNFGGLLVGRQSAAQSVKLTNTGNAPMQVTGASVSGASAGSFKVLAPVGAFSIAVGGAVDVQVVATPAAMGELVGRLDLATNVPGAATAHVDLTALGMSNVLSLGKASIDFGAVKAGGAAAEVEFTLSNGTSEPLPLKSPTFAGAATSSFTVKLSETIVPPQGSVTVTVGYAPTSAGTHAAELVLGIDAPALPMIRVPVSGTAVSQILVAEPATLSFGSVPGGETREQVVTLTNRTSSVVTLTGSAPSGEEFTVVSAPPLAIEPGGAVQVTVAFKASTLAKTSQGTIGVLLDDAPASAPELVLAASGTSIVEEGGCSSAGGATMLWALLALGIPALRRRRARR